MCNTIWKAEITTVNSSQCLKKKCSKVKWTCIHRKQLYQNEWVGFVGSFQPHPSLEWGGKSWTWVRAFWSWAQTSQTVQAPLYLLLWFPVVYILWEEPIVSWKSTKATLNWGPHWCAPELWERLTSSALENASGTLAEWRCKGRGREMMQFLSQLRRRVAEMNEICEEIYIRG